MLVYTPSLILLGAQLILLPYLDWDDPRVRRSIMFINGVFFVRYLWWRSFDTLPHFAWTVPVAIAYVFCGFEVLLGIFTLESQRDLVRPMRRSREADEQAAWYGATPPRVAVMIATYNESVDIVRRTIIGVMSMDYPDFSVWVLDDGRRDWLRDLCSELRVGYLARANNIGYKSGNLNNALAILERQDPTEFIAVFDADFVPRRNFLGRVMALMRDENVAMAQTPQFYFNPDPFQHTFGAHAAWPDDTRVFFEAYLPCADAIGDAQCCGTSFVARCAPIRAIGGFATESVSDDTLTGLKLERAGYRVVYLDECLSSGLATEGLSEYLAQRGRWCLGNLQIARGPWGSAARRKGWRRAVSLVRGFRHPLYNLMFWFWLVFPVVFFFTGFSLVQADTEDSIAHFLPLIALRPATVWIRRGAFLPIVSETAQLVGSFAVLRAGWQALWRPHGRAFTITAKGSIRGEYVVHWRYLVPLAAILVLTVVGLIVSASPHATNRTVDTRGWIVYFAFQKLLVLYMACAVCVERPKYRSAERFATGADVRIQIDGPWRPARLVDLSEGGCQLSFAVPLATGTTCAIEIARVGTLNGRVVRTAGVDRHGIQFTLTRAQETALIAELYCTHDYFKPPRSWSFLRAMQPLLRSLCGR